MGAGQVPWSVWWSVPPRELWWSTLRDDWQDLLAVYFIAFVCFVWALKWERERVEERRIPRTRSATQQVVRNAQPKWERERVEERRIPRTRSATQQVVRNAQPSGATSALAAAIQTLLSRRRQSQVNDGDEERRSSAHAAPAAAAQTQPSRTRHREERKTAYSKEALVCSPNLPAADARWANKPVAQSLSFADLMSGTDLKRASQSLHGLQAGLEVAALGPAAASIRRPGSGPSGASPCPSPALTPIRIQRSSSGGSLSSGSLFYCAVVKANIAANLASQKLRRQAALTQDQSLAHTRWQQGPVRRRQSSKAQSFIDPE